MITVNPEAMIGAELDNFKEEQCVQDDWKCRRLMWVTFVTDSLRRIGTADFSNFRGDLIVSLAFMILCIISW